MSVQVALDVAGAAGIEAHLHAEVTVRRGGLHHSRAQREVFLAAVGEVVTQLGLYQACMQRAGYRLIRRAVEVAVKADGAVVVDVLREPGRERSQWQLLGLEVRMPGSGLGLGGGAEARIALALKAQGAKLELLRRQFQCGRRLKGKLEFRAVTGSEFLHVALPASVPKAAVQGG